MVKFSGSKRKGQHLRKNVDTDDYNELTLAAPINNKPNDAVAIKTRDPKKIAIIIAAVVLGLLLLGFAYMYFFVKSAISTPPPVRLNPKGPEYTQSEDPSHTINVRRPGRVTEDGEEVYFERDPNKITFLILATDNGGGNTDTIMVAMFDSKEYTLEVVNIPRDTLANVSWSNRRVNAIYSNMRYRHGWDNSLIPDAMDSTVEAFADILGFEVDYWFLVDMTAFVSIVNAIDGVDFYVPNRMYYSDPEQGLLIDYAEGMQRLYGQDALNVLRYRSYATADIGRIGNQQNFLMAAAEQILAKSTLFNVPEFVNIIVRYVKTNLALEGLLWLGAEFAKMDSENINFTLLPGNYGDSVGGVSHVTIYIDEWLEVVNERLSPFTEDFIPEDFSILTRDAYGNLIATDGVQGGTQAWASSGGAGNSGSSWTGGGGGGASPQTPIYSDGNDSDVDDELSTDDGDNEKPTDDDLIDDPDADDSDGVSDNEDEIDDIDGIDDEVDTVDKDDEVDETDGSDDDSEIPPDEIDPIENDPIDDEPPVNDGETEDPPEVSE